jgi:hypothetical protein
LGMVWSRGECNIRIIYGFVAHHFPLNFLSHPFFPWELCRCPRLLSPLSDGLACRRWQGRGGRPPMYNCSDRARVWSGLGLGVSHVAYCIVKSGRTSSDLACGFRWG